MTLSSVTGPRREAQKVAARKPGNWLRAAFVRWNRSAAHAGRRALLLDAGEERLALGAHRVADALVRARRVGARVDAHHEVVAALERGRVLLTGRLLGCTLVLLAVGAALAGLGGGLAGRAGVRHRGARVRLGGVAGRVRCAAVGRGRVLNRAAEREQRTQRDSRSDIPKLHGDLLRR